jgi:Bacterial Ig-like domain (group 2)
VRGSILTVREQKHVERYFQSATLLNNGMVLIAGGWSGCCLLTGSAELYEPATRTPPDLESIAITPERSTLPPGETQHFIATGTFRDGSTQQLASVTWRSFDPAVAQISNDATNHGVALAIKEGTVIIMATAGHVRGWARLTVQ